MDTIKFKITDETLTIDDKSWEIDDINAVYYTKLRSSTLLAPVYGILIDTDDKSYELNYKSDKDIDVIKEYCKITKAIKKVNPHFKDYYPFTFNFKNVKILDFKKVPFKKWLAKVSFGNMVYSFRTTEEEMGNLVEDNSKAKETNYNL